MSSGALDVSLSVQIPRQAQATGNRLVQKSSGLYEMPPCPPMRPLDGRAPEEVKGEGGGT